MRTITVITTTSETPIAIETSATTWGELRQTRELSSLPLDGKLIMLRSTKEEISSDSFRLPNEDDFIFISPKKVKSGTIMSDEDFSAIKTEVDSEIANQIISKGYDVEKIKSELRG